MLLNTTYADASRVYVQCRELFSFRMTDFGSAAAKQLRAKSERMHYFTTDTSYLESRAVPPNIHFIPFATNFHYVPVTPGFDVALERPAASSLRSALAEATVDESAAGVDGSATGSGASAVGPPPRRGGWNPAALTAHERPLLAVYIGMDSRGKKALMKQQRWGWGVKRQVLCP